MRAVLLGLMAITVAAPSSASTIAITNARLMTVSAAGTINNGTLLITDGKITAVGANLSVPAGARVIDAAGQIVTPGFIAASSDLGLTEVAAVRSTREDSAAKTLGPANDLQYGVNPATLLAAEARRAGITRAMATPAPAGEDDEDEADMATSGMHQTAQLFGGQAVGVRMTSNESATVFAPHAAITLDLGEAGASSAGSRGAAMVLAHEALEDARRYARHRAEFETHEIASTYSRADLEALQPVLAGTMPLLVRAHQASDLRQVLSFAQREKVRIIIEGAEEGWQVAAELAQSKTPVIIDSESDLPSSFEAIGSRLDNAARLQAAGVSVSIVGSHSYTTLRQARLNAGTAVANGLGYDAALACLTINPATAWGISDRVGSLQAGRDADVVVWNGDPLEIASYPVLVLIQGKEQPLSSRKLDLRDRYLPQDTAARSSK